LEELYRIAHFIAKNLSAAQQLNAVVRRKPLKRFPYTVYYFQATEHILGVLAVLHQAQNPDILSERKPDP
jgi:plasmid stabilization system protein ParE